MKKYRMKMTNSVSPSVWNKVKLTQYKNNTTNSVITPAMFDKEVKEYDNGTLPFEHDLYIGERL